MLGLGGRGLCLAIVIHNLNDLSAEDPGIEEIERREGGEKREVYTT